MARRVWIRRRSIVRVQRRRRVEQILRKHTRTEYAILFYTRIGHSRRV